jgi:HPr kinase/phosphorylase
MPSAGGLHEPPVSYHPITVADFFSAVSERLQLTWIAGHAGGEKLLTSDTVQKPSLALIGHHSFVHPNRVQVLGCAEMDYLRNLPGDKLSEAIDHLFANEIAAVVIANGEAVSDSMIERADRSATPLFTSPEAGPQLMRVLSHMMTQALAPSTLLHGVFLEVSGLGVLITGAPSAGKSELALELITRGHRLVADDALEVRPIRWKDVVPRCCSISWKCADLAC